MLLEAIRNSMIERGAILPNWKVTLVQVENANGSDWANVTVNVFRPRCRKPLVVWDIAVYLPRDQIWWDKSSFVRV